MLMYLAICFWESKILLFLFLAAYAAYSWCQTQCMRDHLDCTWRSSGTVRRKLRASSATKAPPTWADRGVPQHPSPRALLPWALMSPLSLDLLGRLLGVKPATLEALSTAFFICIVSRINCRATELLMSLAYIKAKIMAHTAVHAWFL